MRGDMAPRPCWWAYVDDLIITSGNAMEIANFKLEMQAQFMLSNLGLLSFYLDIEVLQRGDGICLSEAAYARKVLDKAGIGTCNACHTHMDPRPKLSKISSGTPCGCY